MALKNKYVDKIVFDYTTSPRSRTWQKLVGGKATAQVSHDTGNPGSTALQNAKFFKSLTKNSSSAHSFIDDIEIRVIIPYDERAWHVNYDKPMDNILWGNDANAIALGHELCYGGSINFEKAYDMYVWFHVYCAKKFGISLARIEGHYRLDPQRRTDPINSFSQNGKTWAGFLKDVQHYFNNWDKADATPVKPNTNVDKHKIIKGDTFWSLAREYETTVARLRQLNPNVNENDLQVGQTITVKKVGDVATQEPVLIDEPKQPVSNSSYLGQRVESIVASLNFYDTPRWSNPSGQVTKGLGFPTIVDKLDVDGGEMYEVKNSAGRTFYITANPKYVKVVKTSTPVKVDPYKGKKIRSKVASLNFYNGKRWTNPSGQVAKGWGFPTIVKKVKVDGADMYEVKNSKGQTFYITANSKYVEIVNA